MELDSDLDNTIKIVPGVSMLAVLSKLNYKPWFALAEYVDNAVQSSINDCDALQKLHGSDYKLRVDIFTDSAEGGRISIRDNAGGIGRESFSRAFRPASPPDNTSGLSEFGMGMKSASCWFASSWRVETTSIGDSNLYSVSFDVDEIVRDQVEELEVESSPHVLESHFTVVTLTNVYKLPAGRTITKIKQHLTDIYRALIRDGRIDLRFNGEQLLYEAPKVLTATYFRNASAEPVEWKKDIAFDFGDGLEVRGFAALRDTGSTSNVGFSLFRRGRVIEGSGEDGYRPSAIFGAGNSYRSQRLFGELHLSGFQVSHTKDGFRWDESEEAFLELLREELDRDPLPLLKQAEGYRKYDPSTSIDRHTKNALDNAVRVAEENLPVAISGINEKPSNVGSERDYQNTADPLERTISFVLNERTWNINVAVIDTGANQWFHRHISTTDPNSIDILLEINAMHPFVVRFGQRDTESIEVLLRLAIAIVVAETVSRQANVRHAGTVTSNINEVLTRALSGP